jgi:hypothetical protein
VQAPIAKATLLELASRGDQFELWNPGKNTLYEGRNSAAGFEVDENGQALAFSARPIHIFDAIMPQPVTLNAPDLRISRTEQQDDEAKYYVLSLYRETGTPEIRLLRQLWIERSQMIVVREDTFTDTGQVAGTVRYSNLAEFQGVLMPRDIRLDRPVDGYSLEMHFNDWRVNPSLEDSMFVLRPSPNALRVVLKEKGVVALF